MNGLEKQEGRLEIRQRLFVSNNFWLFCCLQAGNKLFNTLDYKILIYFNRETSLKVAL